MNRILLSLLILGVLAGNALARFGETPDQCVERYGAAITNLPGHADVERISIHTKDDLFIAIVFFRGADNPSTAGLIFYSRAKPFAHGYSAAANLEPENENIILATVKGLWSEDKPVKGLEGPKAFGSINTSSGRTFSNNAIPKVKPISNSPGITAGTGSKVAKAVQDVLHVIYPHASSLTLISLGHNGPRLFAFRVLHGVAICSADKISSLTQWTEHTQELKAKPARTPIIGL